MRRMVRVVPLAAMICLLCASASAANVSLGLRAGSSIPNLHAFNWGIEGGIGASQPLLGVAFELDVRGARA